MTVTDVQVRKLMEEQSKHGKLSLAALRAGMDRKTARKYVTSGKYPSESKTDRCWRTRQDPFEEDCPEIAARLADAPELEAKALFEHLLGQKPDRYEPGQLRTFQRRVKQWRASEGPRAHRAAQNHCANSCPPRPADGTLLSPPQELRHSSSSPSMSSTRISRPPT